VSGAEARRARRRGDLLPQPIAVSSLAKESEIAGVPVRLFTPDRPVATIAYLHGGGFVFGAARLQDKRLEELAVACRATVVSVDYRLAPEFPYPAAPDDCEAVACELAASGTLAIVGESAGANLAVVTMLRLRARGDVAQVRAAALVSGVYDLALGAFAQSVSGPLTREELEPLIEDYVGDASRSDPELSPLNAELRDLPPVLLVVGSLDPLLQDSVGLARRWQQAGSSARLEVIERGVHGVDASPYVQHFLRAQLGVS
jgi:acetyl esterase/lipase